MMNKKILFAFCLCVFATGGLFSFKLINELEDTNPWELASY